MSAVWHGSHIYPDMDMAVRGANNPWEPQSLFFRFFFLRFLRSLPVAPTFLGFALCVPGPVLLFYKRASKGRYFTKVLQKVHHI